MVLTSTTAASDPAPTPASTPLSEFGPHISIADVSCSSTLGSTQHGHFDGYVALIWPFSTRLNTISLLLAENVASSRLKGQQGRIKLRFTGCPATKLHGSRVQIGDRIKVALRFATWESEEKNGSVGAKSAEGSKGGGFLGFSDSLLAEIYRDSKLVDTINIPPGQNPALASSLKRQRLSYGPEPSEFSTPVPSLAKRLRRSEDPFCSAASSSPSNTLSIFGIDINLEDNGAGAGQDGADIDLAETSLLKTTGSIWGMKNWRVARETSPQRKDAVDGVVDDDVANSGLAVASPPALQEANADLITPTDSLVGEAKNIPSKQPDERAGLEGAEEQMLDVEERKQLEDVKDTDTHECVIREHTATSPNDDVAGKLCEVNPSSEAQSSPTPDSPRARLKEHPVEPCDDDIRNQKNEGLKVEQSEECQQSPSSPHDSETSDPNLPSVDRAPVELEDDNNAEQELPFSGSQGSQYIMPSGSSVASGATPDAQIAVSLEQAPGDQKEDQDRYGDTLASLPSRPAESPIDPDVSNFSLVVNGLSTNSHTSPRLQGTKKVLPNNPPEDPSGTDPRLPQAKETPALNIAIQLDSPVDVDDISTPMSSISTSTSQSGKKKRKNKHRAGKKLKNKQKQKEETKTASDPPFGIPIPACFLSFQSTDQEESDADGTLVDSSECSSLAPTPIQTNKAFSTMITTSTTTITTATTTVTTATTSAASSGLAALQSPLFSPPALPPTPNLRPVSSTPLPLPSPLPISFGEGNGGAGSVTGLAGARSSPLKNSILIPGDEELEECLPAGDEGLGGNDSVPTAESSQALK